MDPDPRGAAPLFDAPTAPANTILESDLGSMGLPELLNTINPSLMDDMNREAPQIMSALMKQEPHQLPHEHHHPPAAVPAVYPPHLPPQQQSAADFGSILDELSNAAGAPTPPQAHQPRVPPPGPRQQVRPPAQAMPAPRHQMLPPRPPPQAQPPQPPQPAAMLRPPGPPQPQPPPPPQPQPQVQKRTLEVVGDPEADDSGGEDAEVKKAMRAERNRQSAAASRERKKHHIKELERRVSMLSAENAQLQVEQLQTIRSRIEKERELLQENRRLKEKVVIQENKIEKLTKQLKHHGIDDDTNLKRPSTWTAGQWGKKG